MASIVDNAMQSNDLNRDQARALKNKLQPMLGYLTRLRKRMAYRGFTPDDELLQVVQRAEMAMHELHIAVHYLSCGDVTMRKPREPQLTQRHNQPQHDGDERRGD